METVINDAIKALAEKARLASASCDAMQYTQAALNLAHTAATLANTKNHLSDVTGLLW